MVGAKNFEGLLRYLRERDLDLDFDRDLRLDFDLLLERDREAFFLDRDLFLEEERLLDDDRLLEDFDLDLLLDFDRRLVDFECRLERFLFSDSERERLLDLLREAFREDLDLGLERLFLPEVDRDRFLKLLDRFRSFFLLPDLDLLLDLSSEESDLPRFFRDPDRDFERDREPDFDDFPESLLSEDFDRFLSLPPSFFLSSSLASIAFFSLSARVAANDSTNDSAELTRACAVDKVPAEAFNSSAASLAAAEAA